MKLDRVLSLSAAGLLALALPTGAFATAEYVNGSGAPSAVAPQVQQSQGNQPWSQPQPTSPSQQSQAPSSGTNQNTSVNRPGVVMIDTVLSNGEGAGTGMVINSSGVVMTNYHVVADSKMIRVVVPGGSTYTATVVGHDATHDVAVLQLQGAKDLQTVKFDTSNANTGQSVTAIGQGGGQGYLLKADGTITALGQSITARDDASLISSEQLSGLIQTNAAVVPGYSGGPLFDSDGEVIGMNTAASSSGNPTGFAIPAAEATKIAGQIQSGTKSDTVHVGKRAALGIMTSPSSAGTGVKVQSVVSGGGAESTGIAANDTITMLNGKPITTSTSLALIMETLYPDDKVSIGWTDTSGGTHTGTITLGANTQN